MSFPASMLPEFVKIPVTGQKKLVLIIISIIIISSNPTKSQSLSSPNDASNSPDSAPNFQPSLAVVIGVLAIMFSLTFLLLVYAKCCHRQTSLHYLNRETFGGLPRSSLSRVSGIDKTVIESLPFFRFSTLKGWRNGLECSICLCKYEDVEILRLLPKCKHAFHIDCVDQWLEKHSGCPLCRCKVSEEDATLFANSNSYRFLSNQSDRAHEVSNLEFFIEREGSTRFGSSRRSIQKIEEENDQEMLHKFNHRIIISDYEHDHLMSKNRWSNLTSSDLLFLKSEMINSLSSNSLNHHQNDQEKVASKSSNKFDRYPPLKTSTNDQNHRDHQVIKIKEEINRKREFEKKIKKFPNGESDIGSSKEPKSAKLVEQRSMSEIIVHPRFLDVESSNKEANLGEISSKEERLKRLWLPIAQRTLQWFANRDQQPQINTKSQV